MIISKKKYIPLRLPIGFFLFFITFISLLLFPDKGDISTIIYLISFSIPLSYYLKRKIEVISFFLYFYFSLNLYSLAPVLNYLTSGNPILLFHTPIAIYSEYLYLNSIINSLVIIFFGSQNNFSDRNPGIRVSKQAQLFLITSGLILFIFQFYATGALSIALEGGNKGEILTNAYKIPQTYLYFILSGVYIFTKDITRNGIRLSLTNIIILSLILLYISFWFFINARGPIILLFIIIFFGIQRIINFKFKLSYIFLALFLYGVLAVASVSRSWKTNFNIPKTIEIIYAHPWVINVGTLEYTWGLENYVILKENHFTQSYPLKTYSDQFISPLSRVFDFEYTTVFKEYRDKLHWKRAEKGGDYAGTGFSLLYELVMNFGYVLFWLPILILFWWLRYIDKMFYRKNNYELYFLFLLPFCLHVGRSGLLIAPFITKYIYSFVLAYFFNRKFWYGSKYIQVQR